MVDMITSLCYNIVEMMINKYTLLAYKDALQREREKLKKAVQTDWCKKIGITYSEERVKSNVKDYFASINCTFNEAAYEEALKGGE